MLFADDFVGVSDSKESLQKLIDVVHGYCNKWRLKANVSKSAVMVFSRNSVEGGWKWGEHKRPEVSSYTYLGIDFGCNGAWDVHLKRVLNNGRKEVNHLHSIISNRPSIEYGSEVWESNKGQTNALESVVLGGGKKNPWVLF